jgi:hypothetical protein
VNYWCPEGEKFFDEYRKSLDSRPQGTTVKGFEYLNMRPLSWSLNMRLELGAEDQQSYQMYLHPI